MQELGSKPLGSLSLGFGVDNRLKKKGDMAGKEAHRLFECVRLKGCGFRGLGFRGLRV